MFASTSGDLQVSSDALAKAKAAQEAAYGMYKIMHQKSREYGKGYYRYFPDMFSDL